MKLGVYLTLLLMLGGTCFAQTRTITNDDLEKFRQQRLAAERDYRENYEAMGFPSPEELDRQIEESKEENAARAAEYRRQKIERERYEALSRPTQSNYFYQQNTNRPAYTRLYGLGGYYYYPGTRTNRHRSTRSPAPGYISNPLIRGAWHRQSQSMRDTYRGNLYLPRKRTRN